METLDPKKKKIYIGIIVACILAMAGILYYGFGGSTGPSQPPVIPVGAGAVPQPTDELPAGTSGGGNGAGGSAMVPTEAGDETYAPPAVFPAEPRFDLSVYQSGKLKSLTDYTPLTVDPSEIGRENPFLGY